MFNKVMLMAYAKDVEDSRYTLSFVASKDGSGINFFSNPDSTRHPDSAFTVKINGKKTDQNYRALSFVAGDEVKIVCKKSFSFPSFSLNAKDYVSNISPLPFMLNYSGKEITSINGTFYNCKSLTSIPENLFSNNLEVTDFGNVFSNCSGLTSIPENLFANNTKVTTFGGAFYGCSGLTSIPENLFSNNPKVTRFSGAFQSCSGLTSIPENLFANNTKVTTFGSAFYGCKSLTSVSERLFSNNAEVTSFYRLFYTCEKLTSVPENLFSNNKKVTNFGELFYMSGLSSIPENLFANNEEVTSFSYAFNYCTRLNSIPSGLFSNNKKVTDFSNTFTSCGAVTPVSGMFDNNTEVTTFSGLFSSCYGVKSIPSGLFDNNTKVKNFSYAFQSCGNLTSIPSGLFDKNTVVTNFEGAFSGCYSLTTVPEGLFDNNTEVTNFKSVFGMSRFTAGCKKLTTVPENLFAKNTKVTAFDSAFNGDIELSGRVKIGSPNVTSCTNFCKDTGAMTVIVPAGSTTEATFRAYSETVTNLTVVPYANGTLTANGTDFTYTDVLGNTITVADGEAKTVEFYVGMEIDNALSVEGNGIVIENNVIVEIAEGFNLTIASTTFAQPLLFKNKKNAVADTTIQIKIDSNNDYDYDVFVGKVETDSEGKATIRLPNELYGEILHIYAEESRKLYMSGFNSFTMNGDVVTVYLTDPI